MPAWALLLPVASATLLVLVGTRPQTPRTAPRADSAVPAPAGSVESWSGSVVVGEGQLSARLSPLQLDPGRQAYDARALRGPLGLGSGDAGEPWRLELELASATATALDLSKLALADAAGPGLTLIEFDEQASALQALFAQPAGPLEPGSRLQLLLWGPAPTGALKLRLGADLELELFSGPVDVNELPTSLAGRVEAPPTAVR